MREEILEKKLPSEEAAINIADHLNLIVSDGEPKWVIRKLPDGWEIFRADHCTSEPA